MFDWVVSLMAHGGYFAIFLLMLAENVFPPIPSELVMPLAGFLAAQGTLSLPRAILAGTMGSLLGACLWYWIGLRFGEARLKRITARHERWLTISPADLEKAAHWFSRNGKRAVLFGRLVPTIRTLISVPAGVTRMRLLPFTVLTTLGSAVWTAALATSGFLLESEYARVAEWVNPASTVVVAGLALWYVARLLRLGRA
jgi:membrane protein DedA with SNARE-associated domain